MYKYFEISEDNLKFINEFKAEQGIKSDKEAFNKIIELYRDSTAEDKNKKMIQILVDVANTLLLSQGIDKCILKDILASEVITQSEDYHKYKVAKAKQKKDTKCYK